MEVLLLLAAGPQSRHRNAPVSQRFEWFGALRWAKHTSLLQSNAPGRGGGGGGRSQMELCKHLSEDRAAAEAEMFPLIRVGGDKTAHTRGFF